MTKIGVIHGRFQLLHNGHMEYLLAGKQRCEYLLIGITNYLSTAKNYDISKIDAHRLTPSANPFSYYERMEMIRLAMLENQIDARSFSIVPFPIEQPEGIFNFAPKDAIYYMTIYDAWGKEKRKILEEMGLHVEVMWERTEAEKPISGTLVRNNIISGNDWQSLVPKSVAEYIKNHNLDQRLKEHG